MVEEHWFFRDPHLEVEALCGEAKQSSVFEVLLSTMTVLNEELNNCFQA